jgi:hypothetical protein
MLVACKPNSPPEGADPARPAADAPAASATDLPVASSPAIERPEAVAPAESAIATQPGMKDSQWSLTKAKVTGNLLTVQFTVRASQEGGLSEDLPLDQISVIDDATSQRYSVVKDQSGQPMVSRANTVNNKLLRVEVSSKGTGIVWLKFPAPPATSSTLSISIPQVGAFDGVAIQR